MISVKLDTAAVVDQFGKAADTIIDAVVQQLFDFTTTLVQDRIQTRIEAKDIRAKYLKGLKPERLPNGFKIMQEDPDMQRLDEGSTPHDIKAGLLAHAKQRTKDGDPYVDVPMLQRTTKRGKGTYIEARSQRDAINKAAQAVTKGGGPIRLLDDITIGHSKTTGEGFKGPVRVAMEGQSSAARVFRRVSKNSPEGSWKHPGSDGLNIFEDIEKQINETAEMMFKELVGGK